MQGISAGKARLGPYILRERLGVGGMAEVFAADRVGPHGFSKRVAIKRILPQLARDMRFVAMFCDEARISAALCHPNIVQVMDFGDCDGDLFMAMEFVDGVSAARLLRAVAARKREVPLDVALYVICEVLRALSYAHEACDADGSPLGIVHRDVSPGNVLLGRRGEVKLTDFGIVRSAFVDRRTYPGELKGKMGYMSPEQVLGRDVDARSDLFTVGIILAELLLARPLFRGRDEMEILTCIHRADLKGLDRMRRSVPAELDAVLRRVLARDVSARFDSARDFLLALEAVAGAEHLDLRQRGLARFVSDLGILPERSKQASGVVRMPADSTPRESTTRRRKAAAERGVTPVPLPETPARLRKLELLQHGDGAGRVEVAELARLVGLGLAGSGATVQVEDGATPVPVAELVTAAQRDAYRFGEALEGLSPFSRFDLPTLLYRLALDGETGLLVARQPPLERRVYFASGVPVFATSNLGAELLGARLVAGGVVDAESIERAVAVGVDRRRHLGEILLSYGFLRPSLLLRALIEQLEERYFGLGSMPGAELVFVPGRMPGEHLPRQPQEGLAFVTRLIRASFRAGELRAFFEACGGERLGSGPGCFVDPMRLGLTQAERRALELSTFARRWTDVVADLEAERLANREETLTALFVGLSLGILTLEGWRPQVARRAGSPQ
jgi:serine/threonine-protein kinase